MRKPDNPWEIVVIIVSCTVIITLSELVVRFDERRLSEEQLEYAWLPSSRDNALIGLSMLVTPLLGLYAVWFHFARTRRWNWRGLLLGKAAVLAILVVDAVVIVSLATAVGLDLE
jgi:hypothetical protein